MIGLRPRLRTRSSLFDLIGKHKIHLPSRDEPTQRSYFEDGVDDLPPLPTSPFPTPVQLPTPYSAASADPFQFTMAPVSG